MKICRARSRPPSACASCARACSVSCLASSWNAACSSGVYAEDALATNATSANPRTMVTDRNLNIVPPDAEAVESGGIAKGGGAGMILYERQSGYQFSLRRHVRLELGGLPFGIAA